MKKMKITQILLLVLLLMFAGCAKPKDPMVPSTSNGLNLDVLMPTTGYTYDVAVTDDYIFAAEDQAGYRIFDTSTNEDILNYYSTLYENMRVIIPNEEEELLFIYNKYGESTGILVFGYQDINSPVIYPGVVGDTSSAFDLKTINHEDGIEIMWSINNSGGDQLFLGGRYTFDEVNNSWSWEGAGGYTFNYEIGKFDVKDDYIFLCSDQLGINIIQRGEYEPIAISSFDTKGLPQAVKVVDNFVYVADRQNGIVIADISDINNPVVVAELATTGYAQELDIEGNVLAVASGGGGAYAFDISNPKTPVKLGSIDDQEIGYTYNVDIHNGYIYAGTRLGVAKLSIND